MFSSRSRLPVFGPRPASVSLPTTTAVGREHKRNIQRHGVIQRLLHPVADGKGVVLGLDDGNRNVLVIQDVIGPLGLAPRDQLAPDDNAALGEEHFAANLECLVPAGLNQGQRDAFGADVRIVPMRLKVADFAA